MARQPECPECGAAVAADEESCPECGAPVPDSGDGAIAGEDALDDIALISGMIIQEEGFGPLEGIG